MTDDQLLDLAEKAALETPVVDQPPGYGIQYHYTEAERIARAVRAALAVVLEHRDLRAKEET